MVFDNCLSSGYSKVKETPPIKNVNNGNNTISEVDIENTGICFPVCSCCFFAYLKIKTTATIAAITEYKKIEKFVQINLGM